ncbi:MAG: S8 family peptidase [Chitinophagia bacterium]
MNPFKSITGIVFSALLLASCQKDEAFTKQNLALDLEAAANNPQVGGQPEFVANELLVKFKAGTSVASRGKALGLLGASVKEHIHTGAMKRSNDNEGIYLLKVNANALDAITKAKGLGEVEYAEPNWIYQHQATSNDPLVSNGSLWGMTGSFGSQASVAWTQNNTGLSTVFVGIIDEGYQFAHVDLSANAGINPGEIPGNGLDDDGNGYKDDVYGWDFDGNNNTVYDGTGDDHGTHVAGTIGAVGGNGIGVAGVNWNVKMMNAKFLGASGGTTANAVKAVDYFTNLKTRATNPVPIIATNNSWGGGGYTQSLFDAIQRANNEGILFVAAAGNSGANIDRRLSYPAAYSNPNVISVASITSSGALSSFSNYGAKNVDLGAPGSAITSTLPGNTYGSYSGTSMATPHVTGAVALYKSLFPSATAADIKTAILNKGTATSSLSGKTVTGKRLNVSGF